MNFYYLGLKQKTIQYNNFFKKAALVESSKTNYNVSYEELFGENINYNELKNFKKISKFYDKFIEIILDEDNNAKFMLYNQAGAKYMKKKRNLVCVNNLNHY